jgi:hypothetical protein
VTPAGGTTIAAPGSLDAVAVSSSQIDLTWADNSSDETGFKIERALANSGPWVEIAVAGENATTYSNTGLAPDTRYFYRVRAFNLSGDSGYSNRSNATTAAATPTTTATPTLTRTPTTTPTSTQTPTPTVTPTPLFTSTPTPTVTPVFSPTPTLTPAGAVEGFFTLSPCRVVDTRDATGPYGGPPLAGGEVRVFTMVGRCGIPSGALAISLNVTAVQPNAGGYLTLYPGGGSLPLASTINYRAGQIRANNAIVRLGPGGTLAVYSGQGGGTAHILIDVNGFFR